MVLFYDFLRIVRLHDCKSFEDKKTFKIEFSFNNSFLNIINYASFLEMQKYYFGFISLYICKSVTDEEDLFDYLVDEQEFNEEVRKLNNKTKLKLIIDKAEFIKIKNKNDANVLYFVENSKFIEFISKDVYYLESEIFSKDKKNIFILGDINQYFYNEFYIVTNMERTNFTKEIEYFIENSKNNMPLDKIDTRNEFCNWVDGSHFLTPDVMHIDTNEVNYVISKEFISSLHKIIIDLIIPFISNFTGIIDNEYKSLINGNKRIKICYDLKPEDYSSEAYEHLYGLYQWIYEESTFDKINICRNVISILVVAKCQGSAYKTILENCDWLATSVQGNFLDFLQKNINSFFNEQNTMIKKLSDNITGINNQVSELTKITTTNITSFLGTVIAAVIGYIAKGDIVYIKILSFLYICFLIINSVFNIPISIIRASQYKNDFNLNKGLYLKLYPDDSSIKKMDDRNCFNSWIFVIYTFFTIGLIAIIIIFIMKTDITTFISKFK